MLALLEQCGNRMGRLQLQKLLFLIAQHQKKASFDFVPYKYGAYSFRATADAKTLCKYGLLSTSDEKVWTKVTTEAFLPQLNKYDQRVVSTVVAQFGGLSNEDLISHTYRKYPYYSINSVIAQRYLDADELRRLKSTVSSTKERHFYTVGYEGKSLEAYFNTLVQAGVSALVDVRRNAMSMKFGFNKSRLDYVSKALGITYYHLPDLGISSDKRRVLNSQQDYDTLFAEYREDTLPYTVKAQIELTEVLKRHQSVAITCFEHEPCQCHRSHLADFMHAHYSDSVPIPVHL
jgi:uncharacterized protein (DUF488 family)